MDGRNVDVGEDGVVTYRASALGGGCTKALVMSRLGMDERPPPADMLARYQEGNLHEGAILNRMKEEGWTIWDEQATVTLMVSGRLRVVGHIDGKGAMKVSDTQMGEARIVEVKTQSKDEFAKFDKDGWDGGLWPSYKWQLSCYMLATGLPAVVVRKDRNSGTIRMEWVDEPFYDLAAVRARVLSVEVLAADGIGPEECGPEKIYPCPFYYLPGHDAPLATKRNGSSGGVPVPRKMLAGEEARKIEQIARQYEIAAANEKVAKSAKDSLRKQLVEAGEGTSGLDLDTGVRVTFWTQKQGRRGLGAEMEDRLRAFLLWWGVGDLDEWRTQSEGPRMRVTLPTTEEEREGGG